MTGPDAARIAVGVSGGGSNLRALAAAADRGELGGAIVARLRRPPVRGPRLGGRAGDRDGARPRGAAPDDRRRPGRGGRRARGRRCPSAAIDLVVLAGYMRIVGPADAGGVPGPDPQHPSVAPARRSPARTPCATRSRHGVAGQRSDRPPRRRDARRRPDRRPGGRPGPARRRRGERSTTGSGRSSTGSCRGRSPWPWPARSASSPARAGWPSTSDRAEAATARAAPRAPVGQRQDRPGRPRPRSRRPRVRARLDRRDRPGAARRRPAGDRRRGRDRLPRDARRPGEDAPPAGPRRDPGRRRLVDHRRQLVAAAIAPFELVVVNLYPFAAAAERPGITFDELVEEIDIGGPSMVRAAAKNHASVAIVTEPGPLRGGPRRARGGGRRARSGSARRSRSRRSGTPPPTTPGSPPSCRRGWPRPASRCPTSPGCPARATRTRRP